MKNFKKISLLLIISLISVMVLGCSKKEKPSTVFNNLKDYLNKQDYKSIYTLLDEDSKSYISEDDFVNKYTNILGSLGSKDISISSEELSTVDKTKESTVSIPFTLSMNSDFGEIDLPDYSLDLTKSNDKSNPWKIKWSEKLILPELEKGEKVKFQRITAVRGELMDRNGTKLASNGKVASVGIHPRKFLTAKDSNIQALSSILDLSTDFIKDKFKDAENKLDEFIPLVKISLNDKEKIQKATSLPGVQYMEVSSRIYNGGEAIGSLIGYTAPITAEELEKSSDKGYGSTSNIGKAGLEQVFETRLKGTDGFKLTATRDGKDVTILQKESSPGENIKLTIDLPLQQKVYTEMSGKKGASSSLDPKTGEVLALVSSPSYDPNIFVTYRSDTLKKQIDSTWSNISVNRFNNSYAPGSIFKLVTASIGLDQGVIKPDEALDIKGASWQKDSSWGGKTITTTVDPGKPVNLKDAFIYSHNIYFAQQALKVDKDKFVEGIKSFGIGEDLPFPYPMAKNQISSDNSLKTDELLADTAYGQGELLITPLHAALMYSAVVNNGNIMNPIIEMSDSNPQKIWKENAISKDNIDILKNDLIAVVNSPEATGNLAKINGVNIGGKTGTAEIKLNQGDTAGTENSWFVGINMDNPKMVIAMMMEDTKSIGGTHYLVPKVKNVLQYSLGS